MGMLIHRHRNSEKKEKPEVKKPEPVTPVRRTRKTK